VRRIRTNGVIENAAGNGSFAFSGENGPATQAGLGSVRAIAVDSTGNLYIASVTTHTIRRVTASTGNIVVIAGNLQAGFRGDGGPAAGSTLFAPDGVGVDGTGNVYIADRNNRRVRRINSGGGISTIAGNGLNRTFQEFGPVRSANLLAPAAMAMDAAGNLYIADTANHRIRKVGTDGRISTLAGTGTPGYAGDDGPAVQALIDRPEGIAVDRSGNVYFTQYGNGENVVRRVSVDGRITRFAGAQKTGGLTENVSALEATFNRVIPIAVEESGAVLVGDILNHAIRRIGTDGRVRTVIGKGTAGFSPDGTRASEAQINAPTCVMPDRIGNIYFCDSDNLRFRKIDTAGIVTTVAGNGKGGFSGDGGPAIEAGISQRIFPALAADGTIYFSDVRNNRIRRIDPYGVITTIAGTGAEGYAGDGGPPSGAVFFQPLAVLLDGAGRLLIADTYNDRIRVILSDSPSFTVDRTTVTFRALQEADGTITLPEQELSLGLRSSLDGVPYEGTLTSLIPGGDALVRAVTRLGGASGVMPAQLQVRVSANNVAGLPALSGTVSVARLTVRAANANPPVREVTIQLEVVPAPRPDLQLGSTSLQFSGVVGGAAQTALLQVRNGGGGKLGIQVEPTVPWLTANVSNAVVTAQDAARVEITATVGSLVPGTYSGAIRVTGDNGQSAVLPAALAVSDRNSSLLISPSALKFVAVAGGRNPAPQAVSVINAGLGALDYSVAVRLIGGGNWLQLGSGSAAGTAVSGRTAPEVQVSVDASRLQPGEYSALATVSSPNSANRQQLGTVSLRVLPPNSEAAPEVAPSGVVFTAAAGEEPGSVTLLVTSSSTTPVEFSSVRATLDGGNWFEQVPAAGVVSANAPARIRLFPALSKLPAGVRNGTLTIVFGDRERTVRTVSVLSLISAGGGASGAKMETREGSSCGSENLFAEIISLQKPRFTVRPGEAVRVRAKVVDGCGRVHVPEASGTANASLTVLNTQQVLKMNHVGNGEWEAVYTAAANQTGDFSLRVLAAFSQGVKLQLGASETVTGTVQAVSGPRSPQVASGAIVNGASFVAQPLVAPGQLISIYGSDLAEQAETASRVPLTTELGGTEVLLGNTSLPLLYVSEGQINAQIPFGLPLNAEQQIVVRKREALGTPERVVVGAAQPGIFTTNRDGAGQGVILAVRPDRTQTIAGPEAPARWGDTVVIYCSGLGPTSPAVAAGVAAPASPLSTVTGTVQVTIGGVSAPVAFAGLTPGSAGLYQINAVIPEGAATGNEVPVRLTISGVESPPITIAVQP
jgi:uncharacterized protein (TIGR03437 family)